MSAKWIGYFFDDSDLSGSELLLALAIADHADSEGMAFPGVDLLAKKIRLGKRRTVDLIKQLEIGGHVKIVRNAGRGRKSVFQLQKVQSGAPFTEQEKVQSGADKRCNPEQEKVQSGAEYIIEPLVNPSITKPRFEKPDEIRLKNKPFLPTNNLQSEINSLLDLVARSVGAKDRHGLIERKWRDAVEVIIREQRDWPEFLQVIESEVKRTKLEPHFFSIKNCVQILQRKSAKKKTGGFLH